MEVICQKYSSPFATGRPESLINGIKGLNLSQDHHDRDAFPLFFGERTKDKREEIPFDQPMFSWNLGGEDDCLHHGFQSCLERESEAGLTLEELAESHLQNQAKEVGGKEGVSSVVVEPVAALKDCGGDLERLEVKENHNTSMAAGELLSTMIASPVGRVLCRRLPTGKRVPCKAFPSSRTCPSGIKPFDFKSPSPDDIVQESQKGRKRGIRK